MDYETGGRSRSNSNASNTSRVTFTQGNKDVSSNSLINVFETSRTKQVKKKGVTVTVNRGESTRLNEVFRFVTERNKMCRALQKHMCGKDKKGNRYDVEIDGKRVELTQRLLTSFDKDMGKQMKEFCTFYASHIKSSTSKTGKYNTTQVKTFVLKNSGAAAALLSDFTNLLENRNRFDEYWSERTFKGDNEKKAGDLYKGVYEYIGRLAIIASRSRKQKKIQPVTNLSGMSSNFVEMFNSPITEMVVGSSGKKTKQKYFESEGDKRAKIYDELDAMDLSYDQLVSLYRQIVDQMYANDTEAANTTRKSFIVYSRPEQSPSEAARVLTTNGDYFCNREGFALIRLATTAVTVDTINRTGAYPSHKPLPDQFNNYLSSVSGAADLAASIASSEGYIQKHALKLFSALKDKSSSSSPDPSNLDSFLEAVNDLDIYSEYYVWVNETMMNDAKKKEKRSHPVVTKMNRSSRETRLDTAAASSSPSHPSIRSRSRGEPSPSPRRSPSPAGSPSPGRGPVASPPRGETTRRGLGRRPATTRM